MENSWSFRGARRIRRHEASLTARITRYALRVGVDAAATRTVLGLHFGAVTDRTLAVGLAGLLDGQVHGGARDLG